MPLAESTLIAPFHRLTGLEPVKSRLRFYYIGILRDRASMNLG